jgi:hypothetical protein
VLFAGHLIGLGDRHCSNILLDKSTAEVIHIDLGIAFEQGRFLPTPELVPFRLTPDIVDGFGATGQDAMGCVVNTSRAMGCVSCWMSQLHEANMGACNSKQTLCCWPAAALCC